MFPADGIPDLHSVILRGGGDILAIGRPGGAADSPTMAAIGQQRASRLRVPDLGCPIGRSGGQPFAIRRPSHPKYLISMSMIGQHALACSSIPHLYGGISGSG